MSHLTQRFSAVLAAFASIIQITSQVDADLVISFPDVTVSPGVFVAPVLVSTNDGSSVSSVNPAVDISLTSGSGSINMVSYNPVAGVAGAGTIWTGKTINSLPSPPGLPNTVAKFNIDSTNGAVSANGNILFITFDATSAAVGSEFAVDVNFMNLTTVAPSNTLSFVSGKISVVPEPSAALLIGSVGLATLMIVVARRLPPLRSGFGLFSP